jgi:hypothetical protein
LDNFFPQKPEEAQNSESRHASDPPEDHKHEKGRGDIERRDELQERAQGRQSVFSDREGHGAEGSDGRKAHQNRHHAKNSAGETLQKLNEGFAARPGER